MRDVYAPAVADAPDTVGRERYARWSRYFNGTDLDLDEAYAYGWSEYHRLLAEMKTEADKILPGAGPWEALAHLDEHGEHIEGVEEVRVWLQSLMDEAIEALDGTHFELAERVRQVESRIAPPGRRGRPVLHRPVGGLLAHRPDLAADHGRRPASRCTTWCPPGTTRAFPAIICRSPSGSMSRTSSPATRPPSGMVSANAEGWALYAERLMDELGFLPDPERRLGYLDAQMMRACRVIVDIGMHLELEIPADSPFHPGERWTPELAQEFFGNHSGRPADFVESELTRYLSMPGAGDRLQARRTGLAAGPGERAHGARRRVRREGLAHGGAVAGVAGTGRPGGRALEALTRGRLFTSG